MVARGDVAWLELEQEGRRPVVVLTRDEALPRLRNVLVALVTRTIRGLDTEVELSPSDGMPVDAPSASTASNRPPSAPNELIMHLDPDRLDAICKALARAAGC